MCVECVTGSLTLTSLQIVNIMILQHYAFMTIIYSNGLFNYDEPLRWAIKFSSITFHDMCVVCNGLVFNFDEPSDSKHNDTTALLAIKILPSYLHIMSILMYVFLATQAVFFVYMTIAYTAVAFVPAAIVYTIYFIIQLVADEAHQQWMYLLSKIGCHRCHCNRCIYIRTRYVCVQTLYHWRKTYYVHYRARASPQEVISISYHFWLCQLLISPQLEHLLSTLITTRLRTTTTLLYSLYPFGIPNCFTSHVCVRLIHL